MSDKEAEETDWSAFAGDIAKLRAHSPRDPMPRLDGKPPAETTKPPAEPRKEKPVKETMHPSDKTCEAWSKLTPNRLTPEQAKAVSDWQARRRILDYWRQFMSLNGRQPTVREAKTALHIGGTTLTPNLRRLREENKIPAARKPGRMKTEGKETIMTDKKPTITEGDEASEKPAKPQASEPDRLKAYVAKEEEQCKAANIKAVGEDYSDYGDPIRLLERYICILDDFANETIRIHRTQYEAIKDDPGFIFADHNSLNDLLNIRHSMAGLIKALKAKENQQ